MKKLLIISTLFLFNSATYPMFQRFGKFGHGYRTHRMNFSTFQHTSQHNKFIKPLMLSAFGAGLAYASYNYGHQDGFTKGHADGLKTGEAIGYEKGYENGLTEDQTSDYDIHSDLYCDVEFKNLKNEKEITGTLKNLKNPGYLKAYYSGYNIGYDTKAYLEEARREREAGVPDRPSMALGAIIGVVIAKFFS